MINDQLLRSVYAPTRAANPSRIGQLYAPSKLYFFAFARHALVDALRLLRIQKNDFVAFPEFICRDLLSAAHFHGAQICFYPVASDLTPRLDNIMAFRPKAILAVNYFGFPQDLQVFHDVATTVGATVIEDNAHGLFSRDSHGQLLGTRSLLGLLSPRKSLPIPNGGTLVLARDFRPALEPKMLPNLRTRNRILELKLGLAPITRSIGPQPARLATQMLRYARFLRYSTLIRTGTEDDEYELPEPINPDHVEEHASAFDFQKMMDQRRELYEFLSAEFSALSEVPTPRLAPGTVPYGFPVVLNANAKKEFDQRLRRFNLESFPWPSLPSAIRPPREHWYNKLHLVRFLW